MDTRIQGIDEVKAAMVRTFGEEPPEWGFVLGSGFGPLAEAMEGATRAHYGELGLPGTTISGHSGEVVVGTLGGRRIAVLSGRLHLYEGHDPDMAVLGLRALIRWGLRRLLTTSSVGGLHEDWEPGSLVVLTDHINLSGQNPLRGANLDELGPRFPDLAAAYTPALRERALAIARELEVPLHQGVYVAMSGPSFETPAEIRMLQRMGADVVGMSVVPETIVAAHAGLENIGFSIVANPGAGLSDMVLDHDTITAGLEKRVSGLVGLVERLVQAP